jgi:hypothetical protein
MLFLSYGPLDGPRGGRQLGVDSARPGAVCWRCRTVLNFVRTLFLIPSAAFSTQKLVEGLTSPLMSSHRQFAHQQRAELPSETASGLVAASPVCIVVQREAPISIAVHRPLDISSRSLRRTHAQTRNGEALIWFLGLHATGRSFFFRLCMPRQRSKKAPALGRG